MKTTIQSFAHTLLIATLGATLSAALGACNGSAPSSADVTADVAVAGSTTGLLGAGTLLSINGTYATCKTHSDGDTWSVIVSGSAHDHDILSVVKDDTDCQLTLTDIEGDADYAASTPIALTGSYQGSSPGFAAGSDPNAFYANAKLSSVAFSGAFTISLAYSVDPSGESDAGVQAGYAVVTSSVSASAVPAPNYTIDVTGLHLTANSDYIVQTATGNAALTAGSVTGQKYVIVGGAVGTTYDDVDTAFAAGVQVAIATSYAASLFTLVGDDLSTADVRTIIISNTVNGVVSYETLAITFTHPS